MNQVALRSLLSRKLRTILTMIAIVLGVSMISGTYVMTDTIDQSFNQIFVQANSKTNVIISGKQIVGGEQGRQQVPSFPESLLGVVQRTPGVAAAGGQISDTAELVGANGQSLGATRGAPSLLFSWLGPRFSVLKLVRGHAPTGDQIVLDGLTMSRHHLRVGQSIGVGVMRLGCPVADAVFAVWEC